MPRTIKSVPKVAINGTTRNRVMIVPLTKPHRVPVRMPMRDALMGDAPACRAAAMVTVASAMIDPTDKSMPPAMMTNVMPSAAVPTIAV